MACVQNKIKWIILNFQSLAQLDLFTFPKKTQKEVKEGFDLCCPYCFWYWEMMNLAWLRYLLFVLLLRKVKENEFSLIKLLAEELKGNERNFISITWCHFGFYFLFFCKQREKKKSMFKGEKKTCSICVLRKLERTLKELKIVFDFCNVRSCILGSCWVNFVLWVADGSSL